MTRRLQMATVALILTMLVGACGGGDDKDVAPTSAASTPATTAPATTSREGNALPRLPGVFAPIPGYSYASLDDSVKDLEQSIASDPDTVEAVAAADGRRVTLDGDSVAVVIAVGFAEQAAGQPGVADEFVKGVTQDDVSTRELTLSGEKATLSTNANGTNTIAWLKGTLALIILGDGTGNDEAVLIPVATALIAANK
jgi:hypothetical protein